MSRWNKEYDEHGNTVRNESSDYQTAKKTEGFFSRNVRLITFLICIGVFLVTFGPLLVLEAKNYFSDVQFRPKMPVENVIKLGEQNGKIREIQVSKYAYETKIMTDVTYYYIEVEPYYLMIAVADHDTKMLISCQFSNLDSGESVDVLTEDVRAFLLDN